MKIVFTWQPEDTDGPRTVYVEDVSPEVRATFEAAFAARDQAPEGTIVLPNCGLEPNDSKRSTFVFRVGRLLSYEVQQ